MQAIRHALLCLSLIPASIIVSSDASAEIGDYDGDGRSDLAVAAVDRARGITSWSVKLSSTGKTRRFTLHRPGDALVPGDFNGDGRTQPAAVYVQSNSHLEWRMLDENGAETRSGWGENGDRPLAGDFDCDGKDDRVAVRKAGGALRWYFLFADGTTREAYQFGEDDDTPWVADVDGDHCDDLVVSRKTDSEIIWFWEKIGDAAASRVHWGWKSDRPMNPYDIDGDGKADFIVVRKTGNTDTAFVRFGADSSTVVSLGRTGDIPLAGNFNGGGAAVLGKVHRGKKSSDPLRYIFNPSAETQSVTQFGKSSQVVILPDSTVVQPGETETPSGGQCDSTSDFSDGSGTGALWKPVSDSTGRAVFLLPASYFTSVESVKVYGKSGSEVAVATKRPYLGNGNRSHFDVSKSASSLSSAKPLTVQLRLKSGRNECRTVPNPTSRID